MRVLQAKPLNSKIEIINDLNKTILQWKNPRGSAAKYLVVIFLLAWLGVWAVALFSTISKILAGNVDPFILFWTIGWSVGGIFAMWNIYLFVRPMKAERLILDYDSLFFQAGTPTFQGIQFRGSEKEKNDDTNTNSKTKYKIPKEQINKVNLERIGERQRLSIDAGAERIEVGYFLTEPEREWLYNVLKEWKGF